MNQTLSQVHSQLHAVVNPISHSQPTLDPLFTNNRPQLVQAEFRGILEDLSAKHSIQSRIKSMREYAEAVRVYRIADVGLLFSTVSDMLREGLPVEARHATFNFLVAVVEGQHEAINDVTRSQFYSIIRRHTKQEDFPFKLLLLRKLTREGRDISCFEKNIGSLLLSWVSNILHLEPQRQKQLSKETVQLLELMGKFIKFNFALFEEEEVSQMILSVCQICVNTHSNEEVNSCLNYFDIVVRYGFIPRISLPHYVQTLCKTVNVERFCKPSWYILRNLLKSHCAYSTVRILCEVLEDPAYRNITNLLRGAVFFLGADRLLFSFLFYFIFFNFILNNFFLSFHHFQGWLVGDTREL